MAELPARYESVLFERGLVLLKQRDPQPRPRPLSLTPIYESDVAFGQRVELPADRTHALWLEIDARPTIIGRIRSLIYRPASVAIATSDDFGTRSYRLIAPVAEAGVIVQPPLSNTRDLNAFVTGNVGNWTKSFTIDARSRFWRSAHVRLSRLDAISLAPHGKSVFEDAGVADLRPESIRSDVDWRVDQLPQPRLLLHPPGEMVFRPPVGRRRLSGEFGIFDGAFTGGQTDGVEFSIWFARGRGSDQRAWGVTLQPLTRTEDRGTHRFSIDLPADSDLRVIIRTGPGPSGKIDWDWSYLSKLRFTSRDP